MLVEKQVQKISRGCRLFYVLRFNIRPFIFRISYNVITEYILIISHAIRLTQNGGIEFNYFVHWITIPKPAPCEAHQQDRPNLAAALSK
jgi:hypothetical protein